MSKKDYEDLALHALEKSKDPELDDTTKDQWAVRAVAYSNLAVASAMKGDG